METLDTMQFQRQPVCAGSRPVLVFQLTHIVPKIVQHAPQEGAPAKALEVPPLWLPLSKQVQQHQRAVGHSAQQTLHISTCELASSPGCRCRMRPAAQNTWVPTHAANRQEVCGHLTLPNGPAEL